MKKNVLAPATMYSTFPMGVLGEDGDMPAFKSQPRILFVTPEALFIPCLSGAMREYRVTHHHRFGNVLSDFILGMYSRGVDLHVGQPDYRQVFSVAHRRPPRKGTKKIPATLVHLTEDRAFYYSGYPDSNDPWQNIKISIAFQREVIHQVIPLVQPDVIHCHDWMTGLIPPAAKAWGIPCVFTFHSRHSAKCHLALIEDMGIDVHAFWRHLFYQDFPTSYERTRDNNPADFLLSGVLAAEHVNTPTPPPRGHDMGAGKTGDKTVLNNLMAEKYKARSASTFCCQDFCEASVRVYEKILRRPAFRFERENDEMHRFWTPGSSVGREQMQPDA